MQVLRTDNASLQKRLEELEREKDELAETVDQLTDDLLEHKETSSKREQQLAEEVEALNRQSTMSHDVKIKRLTQEVKALKQELIDTNTRWKGENEDLQNIYAEADVYKRRLEKEVADLDTTRLKLEQAYTDIAVQRQELEQERQMLQESARKMFVAERIVDRPPDYKRLAVAFDSVLTDCARRVMAISRGQDVPESADLKSHLKNTLPDETRESLLPLKAFILTFKENHSRRLDQIKENVSKQISLLHDRAAAEGTKLARPLPSPNLSPISAKKSPSKVASRLKNLSERINERGTVKHDSSLMLLEDEDTRQAEFKHYLPKRSTN